MSAAQDKRRIGVHVAAAFLVSMLILVLGIVPALKQGAEVQARRTALLDDLQGVPEERSNPGLRTRLHALRQAHQTWRDHQSNVLKRITTFRAFEPRVQQEAALNPEGRIDFKVALFDSRIRLQARARSRDVKVPDDLGMPEDVSSDKNADILLWQLAATVRLMETAIDNPLPEVVRVQALDPFVLEPVSTEGEVLREFPVDLTVTSRLDPLVTFTRFVQQSRTPFMLRRFSIEKVAPDTEELVSHWVYSAFVQTPAALEASPGEGVP